MIRFRLHLPLLLRSYVDTLVGALTALGYIVEPAIRQAGSQKMTTHLEEKNNMCVVFNINIKKNITLEDANVEIIQALATHKIKYYSFYLLDLATTNGRVALGNVFSPSAPSTTTHPMFATTKKPPTHQVN